MRAYFVIALILVASICVYPPSQATRTEQVKEAGDVIALSNSTIPLRIFGEVVSAGEWFIAMDHGAIVNDTEFSILRQRLVYTDGKAFIFSDVRKLYNGSQLFLASTIICRDSILRLNFTPTAASAGDFDGDNRYEIVYCKGSDVFVQGIGNFSAPFEVKALAATDFAIGLANDTSLAVYAPNGTQLYLPQLGQYDELILLKESAGVIVWLFRQDTEYYLITYDRSGLHMELLKLSWKPIGADYDDGVLVVSNGTETLILRGDGNATVPAGGQVKVISNLVFINASSGVEVYDIYGSKISSFTTPAVPYYNGSYYFVTRDCMLYDLNGNFVGRIKGCGELKFSCLETSIVVAADYDAIVVYANGTVREFSFDRRIIAVFHSYDSVFFYLDNNTAVSDRSLSLTAEDLTFVAFNGTTLVYATSNGTIFLPWGKLQVNGTVNFISLSPQPIAFFWNYTLSPISPPYSILTYEIGAVLLRNGTEMRVKFQTYTTGTISRKRSFFSVSYQGFAVTASIEVLFDAYFSFLTFVWALKRGEELSLKISSPAYGEMRPFFRGDKFVFVNDTISKSTYRPDGAFVVWNEILKYSGETAICGSYGANVTDSKVRAGKFELMLRGVEGILTIPGEPLKLTYIKDGKVVAVELTEDFSPPGVEVLSTTFTESSKYTVKFGAWDDVMLSKAVISYSLGSTQVPLDGRNCVVSTEIKLKEGWNNITVTVYDLAGKSASVSFTVLYDKEAPSITVLYPLNMSYINESFVKPEVIIHDESLARYEILIDGRNATSGLVLDDGKHVLEVIAWDEANRTSEVRIVFFVDTVPPEVRVYVPYYSNSPSVTIKVFLSEECNVTVKVDGKDVPVNSTMSLEEGSHIVKVTAVDKAGNVGRAKKCFFVDITPPSVSINIKNGSTVLAGKLTLELSASDNLGVSNLMVELDGEPVYSGPPISSLELEVKVSEHLIKVEAVDFAGNVAKVTVSFRAESGIEIAGHIVPYRIIAIITGSVVTIVAYFVVRAVRKRRRR